MAAYFFYKIMTALKLQLNNVGDINKNSLPFKSNFFTLYQVTGKKWRKNNNAPNTFCERVQRFMFQLTFKELHGAVWVTSQCQFYGWSANPHPPLSIPCCHQTNNSCCRNNNNKIIIKQPFLMATKNILTLYAP